MVVDWSDIERRTYIGFSCYQCHIRDGVSQ
jgi:hypothetical protein